MLSIAILIAAASAGAAPPVKACRSHDPQRVALPSTPQDLGTEHLVVSVVVMDQRWGKGKPVAGVDIAVGVGCGHAPGVPVQATVKTDAEGRVRMEIPWSMVDEARSSSARIWARATGPGWMGQTRRVRIPETLKPVELKVLAQPGFTVRGRLFDQRGNPVPGRIEGRAVVVDGENAHAFGSVCDEGWFELHTTHAGIYEMMGQAASSGYAERLSQIDKSIGVLRDVRVDADNLEQVLRLELVGAGVVRGRVRTAGGEPVAGLELSLVRLSDREDGGGANFRRYKELCWEGAGGCGGEIRTAEDGRFEIRGLRADRFEINDSHNAGSLTSAPVPSDGKQIELTIDHPHLVVRVLDAAGEPWSPEVAGSASYSTRYPKNWPKEPRLIVTPTRGSLVDADWNPFRMESLLRGRACESGAISFDVIPGQEYLVEILGGQSYCPPHRIRMPIQSGRVDLTLRVGPAPVLGTVSVSAPELDATRALALVVRIEDLRSGRAILRAETYSSTEWPLKLSIPAGDYRLAVEGRPSIGMQHGILYQTSQKGRFEADLTVVSGEVTPVGARLPAGARIDLSLLGKVGESDREMLKQAQRGFLAQNVEVFAARAECRLIAPNRMPRAVEFVYQETGSSAAGRHLGIHLTIGTRQVSEIVPAGDYTLVVRMPGGRTVMAEVSLTDGVTTPVEMTIPD